MRCGGSKGKWKEGINKVTEQTGLEGVCLFEFRYVCKRTASEIASLNLTIDQELPDISFPVGDLTANK